MMRWGNETGRQDRRKDGEMGWMRQIMIIWVDETGILGGNN